MLVGSFPFSSFRSNCSHALRSNAGNAASQFVLGDGYEKGHLGLAKDRGRALEWYQKAAAQGNLDAAGRLKKMGQ